MAYEENMGEVFDSHLKVTNPKTLAEHLMLFVRGYTFFVENFTDTELVAKCGGIPIKITYYDNYLMLKVFGQDDDIEETLRRAIRPIFWGKLSKNKKHRVSEEILHYCVFGEDESCFDMDEAISVTIWDGVNPERTIKKFLEALNIGLSDFTDIDIYYYEDTQPDYLFKHSIYGAAIDDILTKDQIKEIDSLEEFELFFYIYNLQQAAKENNNNGFGEDDPDFLYDVRDMKFQRLISYLSQQVAKFGINVNPPSEGPVMPTDEFLAWMAWWQQALGEAIQENPNLFDDWAARFERGFDPAFRPKTDLGDFMAEFKKKRKSSLAPEDEEEEEEEKEDPSRAKTIQDRFNRLVDKMDRQSRKSAEEIDEGMNPFQE